MKKGLSLFLNRYMLSLSAVVMCTVLFSPLAKAKIYKWVDENGKVHFSDDTKRSINKDAETVVVQDKYSVPVVKELDAIPYDGEKVSRALTLSDITLDLPRSNDEDVLIGRVVCGNPVDFYWTKGYTQLERDNLSALFVSTMEKHGYVARVGTASREDGELELRATIKRVFINTCVKKRSTKASQDSSYLKVEWTVYDPLYDKELVVFSTRGSHHGLDEQAQVDGVAISLRKAFAVAVNNMLANTTITTALAEDVDAQAEQFKTAAIKLGLDYSRGSGSFEKNANFLKKRTVIVKTESGHGSGVFVADGGYILTNAHVVGDYTSFNIQSDAGSFSAKLVKKNEARDVALLVVDKPSSAPSPVPLKRNRVGVGEELYVIGTPLDVKFSHTITRGIVSAKRKLRGMNFIQTDASVNRGNSGGPAFNSQGQLVAITVSSLMTRDGGTLNINYLIPIQDALKRLNIDEGASGSRSVKGILKSFLGMGDQADIESSGKLAGSLIDEERSRLDRVESGVIDIIFDWLNEPVYYF